MPIPSDLMVLRTRYYYHESGVPSCTFQHRFSSQKSSISGLSTAQQAQQARSSGRWEEGNNNMQRAYVSSRAKASKLNQVLLLGFHPGNNGLRNLGSLKNSGSLQSMDSSALRVLIGNARLLGSVAGREKGGNGAGSRPVITLTPRRSFRESRKLMITHKPGHGQRSSNNSSRVESTSDFSAQRLLECAVDVLRNFNQKVNGLRYRWGGDTGSHDFATAAQEKLPELSVDNKKKSAVIENAGATEEELGEVANGSGSGSGGSGKAEGGEFEWRSALWEAEVSSVEELEAVSSKNSHGGPVSLGADVDFSRSNGLEVPQSALGEAEVETRAEERFKQTETAANAPILELEVEQTGNGKVVVEVQASDGASSVKVEEVGQAEVKTLADETAANGTILELEVEQTGKVVVEVQEGDGASSVKVEEVDIGELWNRGNPDYVSLSSSEPSSNFEPQPWSSREIVERDEGQASIEETAEQSAVPEPSLIIEVQPRASVVNVEIEIAQTPAPQIDRADTIFNTQEQADQRSNSEPASILENQARRAPGNVQLKILQHSAPPVLDRGGPVSPIERQAAKSVDSEQSLILEPQPGNFLASEGDTVIEKREETQSPLEEKITRNGSLPEGLSLQQDSQTVTPLGRLEAVETSPHEGKIFTGEGSVVNVERSISPDQERTSEDFGEPFREQKTDAGKVAGERQIPADLITDPDFSADIDIGGMEIQDSLNLDRLRRSVSHHAYLYNTLDTPVISDAAYDSLVKELERLEVPASDSELSRKSVVGSEPSPEMLKVTHSVPMLSLASVQTEEEVVLWHDKLQQKLGSAERSVGYVVEPKVDGLALSLRYENGQLKCAATRGNGMQGEDVTHNAQNVLGIPLTIPQQLPGTENRLTLLEVRGEIFMSLKHFKELNAAKMRAWEKPMANPRNAAAGSMRLLYSSTSSELRPLSFIAYSIANIAALPAEEGVEKSAQKPEKQWEALQLLKSFGFAVNKDNQSFESFDSALEYAKSWRSTRKNLEYEADGVVLKVNDRATQVSLGSAGADPRWAIAWKFAATEAVSVLEGIELTVGRSGAIIPTARFKSVELGGVNVSRASLHNIGHAMSLGLHEGDHIVVQRAGDVIPQVVQVLKDLRLATAKQWWPPKECPSCGSGLTETLGGAMVLCPNSSCESRHTRQVAHFAKTLIAGLGSATLSQLEEGLLVKDPADFYDLNEQALSNLRGFGKLSATKLLKAIEESKQQELWLFIAALGIPRVGTNTAKELADRFGSLHALLKSHISDLVDVPGIGLATAACIFDWCRSQSNIELVRRLEEAGCKLSAWETDEKPEEDEDGFLSGPGWANESQREPDAVESKEDLQRLAKIEPEVNHDDLNESEVPLTRQPTTPKLHGKTVVITGDFGTLLRVDMKKLVTLHGGTVRTAVTSKTSFVLCGKRPGPVKITEAMRRGTEIMDWDSFSRLIGQPSDATP